jgi:hypothetical protein
MVFVSHSGEDTWVARQIAREIGQCGARAILDEADIGIGSDTDDELRNYLNDADELLVLLTPWALERPYIWVEVGVVWSKRMPFVVVLHGISRQELLSRPEVPTFVKAKNVVRLNDIDTYFHQLKQRASGGNADAT